MQFQKWPKINFWTGKKFKTEYFPWKLKFYLIFMENIQRKNFVKSSHCSISQQARKFKKVQAKNLWNQIIKKKFREIAFLAVLNFFPVQKLIFGHFWNCKKWILVKKIFREIDAFWHFQKCQKMTFATYRNVKKCFKRKKKSRPKKPREIK